MMLSLTLGRTVICLSLLNFIFADAGCPRKANSLQAPATKIETRVYRADNGYELAITSLGGIVGLRGPKELAAVSAPVRDYYRLTYKDRRGRQVVASTATVGDKRGETGPSNFVPVSFESPPSGAVFSDAKPLASKVTVRTSDGLLRLTHLLTWKPGSDSVSVQTEIASSDAKQAVSVIAFERVIEVAEGEAVKARFRRFLRNSPGQENAFLVDLEDRCLPPNCPPPPPLGFYVVTADPAALFVRAETTGGRPENFKASMAPQSDGAASFVWEFKSPLSRQTPAVVTTRFSLSDKTMP
ncbi:MAG TPA: hypothetical protein VK422_10710 [Pyrinomonadaceae bacterium]|nr:hypothetical protein [Pyrinomonadaceae bacterium]